MRARLPGQRRLAMLAVIGMLLLPWSAHAQKTAKRVIAIHGGNEAFPGNVRFEDALRASLASDPTNEIEYFAEYLETEEFGEAANTSLRNYIREKYRDKPVDVVFANTRPALDFALQYRDELFPHLPIVFVATLPPENLLLGEIPGVTGIVRDPSQTGTLELALKVHPRTTRVHVVAYAPLTEGYEERLASTLAGVARGVTLTYANEPTLAEAIATIRHLPADTLIFYARYSPIPMGRLMLPSEIFDQIFAASPVPIYSSNDTNFGRGVLGGMMRSEVDMAGRLGEMIRKILSGTKPEDIPIEDAQLKVIFDWRQMQHWRLNPKSLPPGADIRFREPTVWELYGSYIIGTLVVVTAQLLLIGGLLQSRARLRRADDTIRAREASLRVSYESVRQMAGRLIHTQEETRAEIARDLHDDVCQKLASVSIGVVSLKSAGGRLDDPQVQADISELDRETHDAFESIRRLSHDLHPAPLRLLGLVATLRSHCQEIARRHGVQAQFCGADDVGEVDPAVALCFFRIAQESLRNSVLHGGARTMTVTLVREAAELDLTVVDDGRGFDVAAVRNSSHGLGLITMEERVNLIGGHMSVASVPGHGTTVRVRAPANPHPVHQEAFSA